MSEAIETTEPVGGGFPIVVIGGGEGAITAFYDLLDALPKHCGFAMIITIQGDHHTHKALHEYLHKQDKLNLTEMTESVKICRDSVYLAPLKLSVTVSNACLHLQRRGSSYGPAMIIDDLFDSLAKDQSINAIGVLLSGPGSDGAIGMQSIKEYGGFTLAQDESAHNDEMPRAAISLNCIDLILSPRQLGEELARLVRHRPVSGINGFETKEVELAKRIFRHLRTHCNVDFTHYKSGTIERRLKRRLALHDMNDLAKYTALVESDLAEAHALCRDLLIKFTEFFRDSEVFEILEESIFPRIIQASSNQMPIRIWVPGCATGEEVYSIAIALNEYLSKHNINKTMQIFGTDVSEEALDTARTARYIENIARNVSPARLQRFFVKEGDRYRIIKAIRDCCTFARQNVAYDPPFSRIDLLSCRNLLIYLDPSLQKRVMSSFHFALQREGILMLGLSETVGAYSELFGAIELKRGKFFVKKPLHSRPFFSFGGVHAPAGSKMQAMSTPSTAAAQSSHETTMAHLRSEADRIATQRYTPASVLCDEEFNVVEFRGDTSPFLTNPPGAPTNDLQRLARPAIFLAISSAIRQIINDGTPLRKTGLKIDVAGEPSEVAVDVLPLRSEGSQSRWFLVFFELSTTAARAPHEQITLWQEIKAAISLRIAGSEARRREDMQSREIERLHEELRATRDQIRLMLEEHESSMEELKSMEEETLSSNEEFQSTNEELETAKEELQSVNEELSTANDELRFRNRELKTLNDEIAQSRDFADAIIEAMAEPLLGLDIHLRVLRANRMFYTTFKTTSRETLNLPLYSLANGQWNTPELRKLFDELTPQQPQIQGREFTAAFVEIGQRTILVNASRLAFTDNVFILLTLLDVTERNDTLRLLREADRQKDEFLAMLAHELRNPLAAINSALMILRQPNADKASKDEAQQIAQRQLGNQIRIVDDLLDVSRITRGIITLSLQKVDLCALVRSAHEGLSASLVARRHEVTLRLPLEPVLVEGDRTRLEQVISNLLANANKYTPEGGRILVSVHRENAEAVLEIADTGIGMAPDFLPKVFDIFVQAERSLDRANGGLGIGLALARRLVQLHGGSIEAHSDGIDKGSKFRIQLPLLKAEYESPNLIDSAESPSSFITPKRILVVDDNQDAAKSMAMLLELNGHVVATAYDGVTGMCLLREFKPHAALLDIGLPGMNGYEMCRQAHNNPDNTNVCFVALTGYGGNENIQEAYAAGFDFHLVKPATLEQINQVLAGITLH